MDDSIYRLRNRDILTLCVVALLFLGVVMVQSASMHVTGDERWQWSEAGLKQIEFAGLALLTFWAVGRFDYKKLGGGTGKRNAILWLLAGSAFLCLIVLIPHVGLQINGARRWLPLLSKHVTLQPSEVAKWSVVVFLAYWLARRPLNMNSFFKGFVPTLAPIVGICLLIVAQDFGTAALIGAAAVMLCLAGKVPLRHLLIAVPPVLAAGFWFVHHKTYRWARVTAFVDPYAAPQKEGYHMIQSLLSFSTGGIFGKGLGNGIQKLGYLPEDTTDFIFAVIAEELGLFGAMLTIALYLGILYMAWQTVKQQKDSFGRLLALGVGSMIGLQALINIAVATVSAPPKGLALPLVSAGGSGLIITCAALGLLYSVGRFGGDSVEAEAVGEGAVEEGSGSVWQKHAPSSLPAAARAGTYTRELPPPTPLPAN